MKINLQILILEIFGGTNRANHQISINALFIINNPKFVEEAHNNNMNCRNLVLFLDRRLLWYFDLGIDAIITDYPLKVAKQLEKYNSNNSDDTIYLEGCKSIEKQNNNLLSCISCKNSYELIYIKEQNRNLCKLIYEIVPDLYIRDKQGIYQERNIFAIKMLMSPIKNEKLCQKNGRTIFYFEWLFEIYVVMIIILIIFLKENLIKE